MADGRVNNSRSHLFTVRLWREEQELRGSVQDLASGATRSFRSWTCLTSFLAEQMETAKGARAAVAEGEER